MTDTKRPWDRLTTENTPRTKRSPRTSRLAGRVNGSAVTPLCSG